MCAGPFSDERTFWGKNLERAAKIKLFANTAVKFRIVTVHWSHNNAWNMYTTRFPCVYVKAAQKKEKIRGFCGLHTFTHDCTILPK